MNLWKIGLRTWIAAGSMMSFAAGWVLFSHSPKPVEMSTPNVASLSTLEPLPPIGQIGTDGFQQAQPLVIQESPFTSFFRPRIRTSGS